jgi:hypothetical protein
MGGALRILSFCTDCGERTPHEWVGGDGAPAKICLQCVLSNFTKPETNQAGAGGFGVSRFQIPKAQLLLPN